MRHVARAAAYRVDLRIGRRHHRERHLGLYRAPSLANHWSFTGGASFNVGGNRSNLNSITIDGGSIENSNGGNGNNFIPMDSVQSVRIVTSNYQAEFGRKPGAGIMAVTKSGSQQFHGVGYW